MAEGGIPNRLNIEAHNEGEGFSMAEQSTEEPLQKRFAMVSGDGDESYSKNSELQASWVSEGLLTQQQQDTFRFPSYHRATEDLREVIASCTSLFSVLTAELHEHEKNVNRLFPTSKPSEIAKKIMTTYEAFLNSIFEAHVGNEVTEIFWKRYEKLAEKKVVSGQDLNGLSGVWVVSLIRK
ncbi:unnamed protein product [Calypogeia fissa]